jgi:hypothetical protein
MTANVLADLSYRRDTARCREEFEYYDRALRYEQAKIMPPTYWNDAPPPMMPSPKYFVSTTPIVARVFDKKLLLI